MKNLTSILQQALDQRPLTPDDLMTLLQLTGATDRQALMQTARVLRARHFGNRVALYGFVYFSTHCRNDCTFCRYRHSNQGYGRYRKSTEDVVATAQALAESGVHLIDLTMGEDPYYLNRGAAGLADLVTLVERVRQRIGLPIMISPGVVPKQVLAELHRAGADWYACYQETHNRQLFTELRLGQSYDRRWTSKIEARDLGMLVEEGLLLGVGDRVEDTVRSLAAMQELQADQVRSMTFVPQPGTPLANRPPIDRTYELNLIAVMRLLHPFACIPASLDVEGIQGLQARLQAGANVVTSIIPPSAGLQGVSQATLDISEGHRTVGGVLPVLAEYGLSVATQAEYQGWLERLRQRHRNPVPEEVLA